MGDSGRYERTGSGVWRLVEPEPRRPAFAAPGPLSRPAAAPASSGSGVRPAAAPPVAVPASSASGPSGSPSGVRSSPSGVRSSTSGVRARTLPGDPVMRSRALAAQARLDAEQGQWASAETNFRLALHYAPNDPRLQAELKAASEAREAARRAPGQRLR